MFYLWRCATLLIGFLIIDHTCSVLTQKDQGSHTLLSEKKSDEQFSIDLNDERRNTSIIFADEEDKGEEERSFIDLKGFGKEKKPRTFFGPLNLDFKDKLNPKRGIIYDTRNSSGGGLIGGSSCCGSRYRIPSYSERPEYVYSESSGAGRYPYRPTERPGDRYGTLSSSYLPGLTGSGSRPGGDDYSSGSGGLYPTRYGPPRGSYSGSSDGNRYDDSRPGYGGGSAGSSDGPSRPGGLYGRPSFSIGGASSYGGYGSTQGGSGQGGGLGFGSGRPGGGYSNYGGSRPDGGSYAGSSAGSYGGNGPGSFGGGSYGGGGYGGFGGNSGPSTFGGSGSTSDFGGGGDYGYGEGGMIGHPTGGNLQTQKALALKALAGVALIGAAAALATNPVLLPLGRKRRSTADDFWNEHPLMLLKEYISQIPRNNVKKEDIAVLSRFLASRKCVARLACEVQREYFADLERYKKSGKRGDNIYHNFEHRFMDLVQSNVLNNSYVNQQLKKEIKLALAIGAQKGNCEVFPCTLPRS